MLRGPKIQTLLKCRKGNTDNKIKMKHGCENQTSKKKYFNSNLTAPGAMSGDRLWVQCCVTIHSHTQLQEGPQRGLTFRGLSQGEEGRPPNRGQGQAGDKALLLGKGDLHGVVLRDLEALQGVASSPGLHLIVKFHKCNVVPPRDQPDLLEAREPRRRGQTSGIWNWHVLLTFWCLVGQPQ